MPKIGKYSPTAYGRPGTRSAEYPVRLREPHKKEDPMTTVIWKSGQGSEPPDKRRTLVESLSWQVRFQSHVWSPPADLFEVENAYLVRVEVAGMRQQDFSIQLENDLLTVSGTRPDTPERRAYHQMEVRFGEFGTVVGLPGPVEIERSSAEYEDGFLIITLPKASTTKIKINQ